MAKSKSERLIFEKLALMETVEKELDRQKSNAVVSLTVFLCSMSVWVLAVSLWEKLNRPFPPHYLTYGVELIAVFMLIFLWRSTDIEIKNLGVNRRNLKATFIRDGAVSLALILIIALVKHAVRPGEPIFYWTRIHPFYAVTSVLQEFLSRGFLLTCLMTIYTGKHRSAVAVICSSLIFTTLHLYYGFTFMCGAGVLSLLLGALYVRDGNIWGVSLIHFVFGTFTTLTGIV